MKRLFITTSAILMLFCISCNQASTSGLSSNDSSMAAQKNLEVVNGINKAIQTGDVSPLDTLLADDAVDHAGSGDVKGKDSIKAELAGIHGASTDMKMEVVREFADADYAIQWMHYSGTGNGSQGMPKGKYDMSAIEVTKLSNGKATEHWEFMQAADMMKMMGNEQGMGKDTSMHK